MSEHVKAIVNAIANLANKDTKDIINVFLFAFMPMVFVLGFMLFMKWVISTMDSMDEPNEKCWDVSKIEEVV